jgi:hypothetical protein
VAVPLSHGRHFLVEDQRFGNRHGETVDGGVQAVEVVEVLSEDDFADGGGAEFEHVLVGVPGFSSFAELVEDGE